MKKYMVTTEFANPIYIAPLSNGEIQVTDKANEAEIWNDFDGDTKLEYHRSITGYNGLKYISI